MFGQGFSWQVLPQVNIRLASRGLKTLSNWNSFSKCPVIHVNKEHTHSAGEYVNQTLYPQQSTTYSERNRYCWAKGGERRIKTLFNNVDGWWPKRQWSWGSPPNVTMQTEKPPKDNCTSTGMFKRPLQHSWQWIVSSRSVVMAETIKQNYTTALDFVGSIPVSSNNNKQHFLHQMENNSTQHTINKWFYIVSAK